MLLLGMGIFEMLKTPYFTFSTFFLILTSSVHPIATLSFKQTTLYISQQDKKEQDGATEEGYTD